MGSKIDKKYLICIFHNYFLYRLLLYSQIYFSIRDNFRAVWKKVVNIRIPYSTS